MPQITSKPSTVEPQSGSEPTVAMVRKAKADVMGMGRPAGFPSGATLTPTPRNGSIDCQDDFRNRFWLIK